jgi:hypothetical protein
MLRMFDCATPSTIGRALPLSTIRRAALAMPCYVGAGTRMDAPSAASQTDSLQWHAFCCNDRLCLILTSAKRSHHKATPFDQPMFLSSTSEPFLCPNLPDTTAPRTEVVKIGRRPPPQAAQRGLDGREHGAKLDPVGSADASPTTPGGAATKFTAPTRRLRAYRPAEIFTCYNGRKSHHPTETIRQPTPTAASGQTSPSGGISASDCFVAMSGSPLATSGASTVRRKRSSGSSNDRPNQLRQCVEQRLRLFQVRGIEAFREPAVDGSQQFLRLSAAALFAQQPREIGGGAQLQ